MINASSLLLHVRGQVVLYAREQVIIGSFVSSTSPNMVVPCLGVAAVGGLGRICDASWHPREVE